MLLRRRAGTEFSTWEPVRGLVWLETLLFVGDKSRPKGQLDLHTPTGLLPCRERPYEVIREELHEKEREPSMARDALINIVPLAAVPGTIVEFDVEDPGLFDSVSWLA